MAFDVKITTFFRPLDLIAPFICRGCGALGEVLCERCKNYNISAISKVCPRCAEKLSDCKCAMPVYAVSKREGILVDMTEDYKYKSIRRVAEVLAELMDQAITIGGTERRKAVSADEQVVVVPLPTISKHVRERGFDHTLLLAKKLAKRRKGWKVQKLLARRNNTVQVGADGDKRRIQAKEAYRVNKAIKVDPRKTYLLVDDVWTTGASIEAAAEVLKSAGAEKLAATVVLMP